MTKFSLADLEKIINERAAASCETSYTKSLMEAGIAKAAKKFGEESFELAIAAVEQNQGALISEAADVLYHMLVLLHIGDVTLAAVLSELERRTSISGIAEKAQRRK